jgi:hypothetical protein
METLGSSETLMPICPDSWHHNPQKKCFNIIVRSWEWISLGFQQWLPPEPGRIHPLLAEKLEIFINPYDGVSRTAA